MDKVNFRELTLLFLLLLLLSPLIGRYMASIFKGDAIVISPLIKPVELFFYRVCGVDPHVEMTWISYVKALLIFNFSGALLTFIQMLVQSWLPLNPEHLPNVPLALAFNTAISFATNTNWQAYSGESTMSHLTQMCGLAVHNFTSAATGIAVFIALVRGLIRHQSSTIGNFWGDLMRSVLYVLLPLSCILAVALVSQGVIQNLDPYRKATPVAIYSKEKNTSSAAKFEVQILPMGPVASQVAIKQLGSNGGGYFGQNSAHPFENPTPLSNFLEILAILLLPSSLVFCFGFMVGDLRQGFSIWVAMFALFAIGFSVAMWAETRPNPVTGLAVPMEGKEQRFGVMSSVLWSVATSGTSNGSVNAMIDSLSPIAGMVAMANLQMGCVGFGGVGAGMYGMIMFVILTVFIAGLMVGRTPEYLGKKIGASEITWAVIAVMLPSALILLGSALAVLIPEGLAGLGNSGPHGLSEILYAFSSCAANNGSAFAGLSVNTPFYNIILGMVMLTGRYAVIIPVLAIAGSLAFKKHAPSGAGTFPTTGLLFSTLLCGVVVIVGALTFLPVLTLGPIVEHLLMTAGRSF
jgi:K+-transporting ATPase ATPase A chain